MRTVPDTSVEAMAHHAYKKLQMHASGPYQILSFQWIKITVGENGNPQTISTDCFGYASSATQLSIDTHNSAGLGLPTPCGDTDEQDAIRETKYIVEKTMRHIEKPLDIKYAVRWYRYSKTQETLEPAEQNFQHFRDCYRRQQKKGNNKQ